MGERRTGIFSTIAKIVAATRKQSNNFRNLKQTNESIVVQLASATVSHLKTSTHQATGGGGRGGARQAMGRAKSKDDALQQLWRQYAIHSLESACFSISPIFRETNYHL